MSEHLAVWLRKAATIRDILECQTERSEGCWLWVGKVNNQGYGRLRVRDGAGGHLTNYAHQAAYRLAHGPIPVGQVVRHSCDNPRCVRPDHLSIGTQRDNVWDMANRDRHPRYHPKATREQIVQRVTSGESIASVARDLNMKYTMAAAVIQRSRHASN